MYTSSLFLDYYNTLKNYYGKSGWWPASSAYEIVVGSVLTQNTSWKNVEIALGNLVNKGSLTASAVLEMPLEELEELIRPSGFYKRKAICLKSVTYFLKNLFLESSNNLFDFLNNAPTYFVDIPTNKLRTLLLEINGIGFETADSILLYAFNRPVFVIDAYTKRIFSRHNLCSSSVLYMSLQRIFEDNLPNVVEVYKEFHAYIVFLGKEFCLKQSGNCKKCPLNCFL